MSSVNVELLSLLENRTAESNFLVLPSMHSRGFPTSDFWQSMRGCVGGGGK